MNKNELENNENEQPEQTPVKKKLVLNKRTIIKFNTNRLKAILGGYTTGNEQVTESNLCGSAGNEDRCND